MAMAGSMSVSRTSITLQNIDNPLSLFETTAEKLAQSGYQRISQTPFIDIASRTKKRKAAARRPTRCPSTRISNVRLRHSSL